MRLRLSMCAHIWLDHLLLACPTPMFLFLLSIVICLRSYSSISTSVFETVLSGAYRIKGQSRYSALTSAQIPEIARGHGPSFPRVLACATAKPDSSLTIHASIISAHVSKPRSPLFGGWWASLHIDNDTPARSVLKSTSSEG